MPGAGILMGKFFIVAISVALVLGAAVVVTYF
jgi:Na+(H+)/acetate symporter ActP